MPFRIPPPSYTAVAATPEGLPMDSAYLLRLVRLVAVEDHLAFADLYNAVSTRLLRKLETMLREPEHARTITRAAFVEVWALARFHVSPETDVYLRLSDIIARRIADRESSETENRPVSAPRDVEGRAAEAPDIRKASSPKRSTPRGWPGRRGGVVVE